MLAASWLVESSFLIQKVGHLDISTNPSRPVIFHSLCRLKKGESPELQYLVQTHFSRDQRRLHYLSPGAQRNVSGLDYEQLLRRARRVTPRTESRWLQGQLSGRRKAAPAAIHRE